MNKKHSVNSVINYFRRIDPYVLMLDTGEYCFLSEAEKKFQEKTVSATCGLERCLRKVVPGF